VDYFTANRKLTNCYNFKIWGEYGKNIFDFHWTLHERGNLSCLKGK